MENRLSLARTLILCGTACILASVAILAYTTYLSSYDAHDHRQQVTTLLARPGVNNVSLARWDPPSTAIAWCSLLGGFVLAARGIQVGQWASLDWNKSLKEEPVSHF